MSQISQRKADHIQLSVDGDVGYRKSAGFERYDFRHNALPEINFSEISLETALLGRKFSAPLFISSMTGGYEKGESINRSLARICQKFNLPLGLGSQRAMLEKPELESTFLSVREEAPDIFVASNIGGAQLISPDLKQLLRIVSSVQANALIVHLNPLQELLQLEGDRNFKGILDGILALCAESPVPVIVKETGAGIDSRTAAFLLQAGVTCIDVAGAGGTSWSAVEIERQSEKRPQNEFFREWGIPTTTCISDVSTLKGAYTFDLISSGGVYGASEILKSLCLGADFTAMARPIIQELMKNGESGLEDWLFQLFESIKTGMLLLGVSKTTDLSPEHLITLR